MATETIKRDTGVAPFSILNPVPTSASPVRNRGCSSDQPPALKSTLASAPSLGKRQHRSSELQNARYVILIRSQPGVAVCVQSTRNTGVARCTVTLPVSSSASPVHVTEDVAQTAILNQLSAQHHPRQTPTPELNPIDVYPARSLARCCRYGCRSGSKFKSSTRVQHHP